MFKSGKYAYVNIGNGEEFLYVRIKKVSPLSEADKTKLIEWAQAKGFTVSNTKRILHAE